MDVDSNLPHEAPPLSLPVPPSPPPISTIAGSSAPSESLQGTGLVGAGDATATGKGSTTGIKLSVSVSNPC